MPDPTDTNPRPGQHSAFRLYDTARRSVVPFVPGDPARITFYTCGPTVYDDAHIGNLRSFLTADLLRRWLESPMCRVTTDDGGAHAGPREVVHVMNITDVGHMTDDANADGAGQDKMALAAERLRNKPPAKKSGAAHTDPSSGTIAVDPNDPRSIAAFYTRRFLEDARRLGLRVALEEPDHPERLPHASDHIDGMRALIETLAQRGLAYRAEDAVYFDVRRFADYGALSGNSLDALRGGAGGRVADANQQQKRDPADFLLWKTDPTHLMRWPGPVFDNEGDTEIKREEGYPGWHIECSAMARALLGDVIDLHSGGEDNIFPHHECEIAQSRGASGHDHFARHWFHIRFLMVEGAKMSKSSGTFLTARDLIGKGHEPAALRLELIKTHYSVNANFTEQGLKDSARLVQRWRRLLDGDAAIDDDARAGAREHARERFAGALHDDLNIAGALGAMNTWVGGLGGAASDHDRALLRELDAVLGVLELAPAASTATALGVFLPGVDASETVETLLHERAQARRDKNYARSDAIRDELAALGYTIKDIAGGKVEVGPA